MDDRDSDAGGSSIAGFKSMIVLAVCWSEGLYMLTNFLCGWYNLW
jgi:hypothetical protein